MERRLFRECPKLDKRRDGYQRRCSRRRRTEFHIELCKDLQIDEQEVENERWEVTYSFGKGPTETYPLIIRVHEIIMAKAEERRAKPGVLPYPRRLPEPTLVHT